MTWLSKFGRWIDPTNKKGGVRGALRAVDPTNKNTIVGRLAPYAVGLIPGIGLPLAAGLGAGFRTVQGVGRGAGIGEIARDAAGGALGATAVRGIAQAVMPGTFAAQAPGGVASSTGSSVLGGGPPDISAADLATMPSVSGAPSVGLPPAPTLPSFPSPPTLPMYDLADVGSTSFGGPTFSNLAGGAAKEMGKQIPRRGTLAGIGSFLTRQPTTIPSLLSTGASIYGASQLGAAEDARLRMEQEQYDRQKVREGNRIGFAEWRRRRAAPGGLPTVV